MRQLKRGVSVPEQSSPAGRISPANARASAIERKEGLAGCRHGGWRRDAAAGSKARVPLSNSSGAQRERNRPRRGRSSRPATRISAAPPLGFRTEKRTGGAPEHGSRDRTAGPAGGRTSDHGAGRCPAEHAERILRGSLLRRQRDGEAEQRCCSDHANHERFPGWLDTGFPYGRTRIFSTQTPGRAPPCRRRAAAEGMPSVLLRGDDLVARREVERGRRRFIMVAGDRVGGVEELQEG